MNQSARIINVILGIWLFISAFIWQHSPEQYSNTWVLGVLTVAFAVVAMRAPWVRFLNTALAVWLFISAWALPSAAVGTVWNNVLVGVAVFIVSLVPSTPGSGEYGRRGTPSAPHPA